MRRWLFMVLMVSALAFAQDTIRVTDTLGTRLLPECGLGITKLGNYLYVPAGKYGINIYNIYIPTTVSLSGNWKVGEIWESELAKDAVAFVDPTGHRRMAVIYESPYVLMRYFDLSSYTSPTVVKTIKPYSEKIIGNSVSYSSGKLLVTARYHDSNQGVFYLYDVATGTPTLVYTWWAESERVIADAALLPTGDPAWIVIALWDSAGVGGGNALRSFAYYPDGYVASGSTYALPSTSRPYRIVPGWADASGDMGFYVALGQDGVGAFKIDRRTGAISLVNTYDDATMSEIVDVDRWGNRLFAADHCTTYASTAYALHILELDTTSMGISTSVVPAHIHGRNARAVYGDSSAVWVVADVPQGSDTTAGAR